MSNKVLYKAAPTIAQFHRSPSFVRGIRGPVGSGKSTGAAVDLIMQSMRLDPCRDGVRRSRHVVIRNTYAELKSTTIKTWEAWFGPANGYPSVVYDTPIRWRYRWAYPAGTPDVDVEVLFLAMDRADDVKKLKSLEVTFAWLNEASELPKAVLDMATARVGRYPHPKDAPPGTPKDEWPSRFGVVMDTNSMDEDHWWHTLAEVERPEGFEFFDQPGGMEPDAENIENLPGGRSYYTRMMQGKRQDWVDVFVHNKYGSAQDGKPIWPEFNAHFHVAREPLPILRGLPLWLGWDFGLTPACVALQVTKTGQVRVLREWLVWDGTMGVRQFARDVVKPALLNEFGGMKLISYGDPGGNMRDQSDEAKAIEALTSVGIPTKKARSNVFQERRDAVGQLLMRVTGGEAGLILDPSCAKLRKGMSGAYKFRRMAVAGDERYADRPDKNAYSHVCEALQYPCLHLTGDLPQKRRRRAPAPRPRLNMVDRKFGY